MTNTSRLKILGIGLVLVGLGAYLLLALGFLPPGHPTVLIILGGLFLPIIGLGCYARAKERSAFWAAMGVVPILGPILALVAIGIDDGLAKRAAPRWVRRVVRVGFALSVPAIFLAIFIPNFLRFGARSPQSEAKNILGGIFVAETSSGTAPLTRLVSHSLEIPTATPTGSIIPANPARCFRRRMEPSHPTTPSSTPGSAPTDRASRPPPRPISTTTPPSISGT